MSIDQLQTMQVIRGKRTTLGPDDAEKGHTGLFHAAPGRPRKADKVRLNLTLIVMLIVILILVLILILMVVLVTVALIAILVTVTVVLILVLILILVTVVLILIMIALAFRVIEYKADVLLITSLTLTLRVHQIVVYTESVCPSIPTQHTPHTHITPLSTPS